MDEEYTLDNIMDKSYTLDNIIEDQEGLIQHLKVKYGEDSRTYIRAKVILVALKRMRER